MLSITMRSRIERGTPVALFFGIFLFILLFVPSSAAAIQPPGDLPLQVPGDPMWSQRFGDASQQQAKAATVDALGNVIVVGTTLTAIDLGGGLLPGSGLFLAKYDASGNHIWSKRFGDSGGQEVHDIDVDAGGNVAITGNFFGTINFGGGTFSELTSADGFIAAFDANGNHIWSRHIDDTMGASGVGLAFDASDNLVTTGLFMGQTNFGGGLLTSSGDFDVYLAKYSTAGGHIWSDRFGDAASQAGMGVAVNPVGDIVLVSDVSGTIDFGGGTLASAGLQDVGVASFDAAGNHQWSQRYGDNSLDIPFDVDIDGFGDIVFTGMFEDSLDFGGGPMVGDFSPDIFAARFTSTGSHVWSQRFGSSGAQQEAWAIAVDAGGNFALTGHITGSVDFGGGTLTSAGNFDVYVAQFAWDGQHIWSKLYGDAQQSYGFGIALDPLGSIVACGYFNGTINFGSGLMLSVGGDDIYLAKIEGSPAGPARITSIDDIGNDQGRLVRIDFQRSPFDASGSPTPIVQYEAYRRIDPLPLIGLHADANVACTDGIGISNTNTLAGEWEFVGAVPAHGKDLYHMIAPTLADSTDGGMHWSVCLIRAATADPITFYDSPPDSGYSLDNLAPSAPLNLAHNAGHLAWDEAPELDFDYYTIYGSPSAIFDENAVKIGYAITPDFDVQSQPYTNFYVTATDFAGNESPAAGISTLTGVDPPEPAKALRVYPNPFNPVTTIAFDVPAGGIPVTLRIYDASGRRIRQLVARELSAGPHRITWDGRDNRGHVVASGVYLCRLEWPGRVQTRKMVMAR